MGPNQASNTAEVTGLTTAEVDERRARGEANTPPPRTTRSYGQIFRENVFTFVNYVLFFSALLSYSSGGPLMPWCPSVS